MFFIPNAIFHGSPEITIGLYIWKGMIPALLGNIIGGGFFVATLYWYLHLQGHDEIAIDGEYYEATHSRRGRPVQLNFWRKARSDDVEVVRGDEKV